MDTTCIIIIICLLLSKMSNLLTFLENCLQQVESFAERDAVGGREGVREGGSEGGRE